MDNKILTIVKKLRNNDKIKAAKNLPALFFFTDRKRFADIFAVVGNLPQGTAIIVREYDLSDEKRLVFSQQIIKIAQVRSLKVLIGKDWQLAIKVRADGVHFSDLDLSLPTLSSQVKRWIVGCRRRSLTSFRVAGVNNAKNLLFTYSCHNSKSIVKAKKLGVDLIFYSPIFATKSHPNQKPLGTLQLRNIALKTSLPVYALGGINEKNIKQLKGCGIFGIGGISIFE